MSTSEAAICIGVDGWHYSQAELRAMEVSLSQLRWIGYRPARTTDSGFGGAPLVRTSQNSEHLFARRGAHFTFNAQSYLSFVKQLSLPVDSTAFPYPSFSHANKDPVESLAQQVKTHHQIM